MITYKTFMDCKIGDEIYSYEKNNNGWNIVIYIVKSDKDGHMQINEKQGGMCCNIDRENIPVVICWFMGPNYMFADKQCLNDMKTIIEESCNYYKHLKKR